MRLWDDRARARRANQSGAMTLAGVIASRAERAAMRTSHASAIATPAPMHNPSISAITGSATASIAAVAALVSPS